VLLQEQKKRVAEETAEARRKGLGLRLLPASKEDAEAAVRVRFGPSNGSAFDENRKKRRAAIRASSIFPDVKSGKEAAAEKRKTDASDERRRKAELLSKGRSIDAFGVSRLLSGSVKRSQPADGSRPSKKHAIAATVGGVS
jgi:coiled-coil domain-containing protein 130